MKPTIPCFLCGNKATVKKTKKDKPYFVCNPCGMQVFIRGSTGILLIEKLLKCDFSKENDENIKILRLTALLNQINHLKGEKLENKPKDEIVDLLNSEIEFGPLVQILENEIKAIKEVLL